MKFRFFMIALTMAISAYGDVAITDVKVQQRYPWNNYIDIDVTLSGSSNDVA